MKAIERLNELIIEAINEGAFPGSNYVLVFKNKSYFGSFGNKALFPNEENNDIDTLYDMASLTKVVSTTTIALKLIEDGLLRLYAPVTKYIPEFRHPDVTVWNLMTHTSGLPEGLTKTYELSSKDEVWSRIIKCDLKYETTSSIHYSDLGYIILGEIVSRITKTPLNVLAEQMVFKPLEMNDTGYLPKDKNRCAPTEKREDNIFRGIIRGDVHDETSFAMGGVAGHAGLFSCVKDLEHFLKMMLNNGIYEGKQFLAPTTIDVLFTPMVKETKGVMINMEKRSLGWINRGSASSAGCLTSEDTILHTGFTGTNIWIDRKNEVAFAMLTNRVHPTRNNGLHIDARARIANYIMAHLTELKGE